MYPTSQHKTNAIGFAGLASMAIPVDDLLNDFPEPHAGASATDIDAILQGRGSERAAQWPLALGGVAVVTGCCLLALYLWHSAFSLPRGIVTTEPVEQTDSGPSNATLVKPAVGDNQVLNRAEIRYCLAEEIRLQAARDLANSTTLDLVRLNASVQDLNARCGSYQYQGDDLALAQADVLVRASEFTASGQRDYLPRSLPVEGLPARTDSMTEQVKAAAGITTDEIAFALNDASDSMVRDIQWLLFNLEFYEGPMSGESTPETIAALRQFLQSELLTDETDLQQVLASLFDARDRRERAIGTVEKPAIAPSDEPTEETVDAPVQSGAAPSPESDQVSVLRPTEPAPSLSNLDDLDRLAIENFCRAAQNGGGYASCLGTQLAKLNAAPRVDLSSLSQADRSRALGRCGPLRNQSGPAAYYRCLSSYRDTKAPTAGALIGTALSQNVVSAIENRCSDLVSGESAEYARCLTGQFANLAEPMEALFVKDLEFSERTAIERVCSKTAGFGDVSAFYECTRNELTALRELGIKPDVRVASFADREMIEAACRESRLSRGPAEYYSCLDAQLENRGY